jgi:Fe-S cluster biogenesis protein NfuA
MIRSVLSKGLKKVLGRDEAQAPKAYPFKYEPQAAKPEPVKAEPVKAEPVKAEAPKPEPVKVVEPEPTKVKVAEPVAEAAAPAMAASDDTVSGPAIDPAAVQELLDEMVRPALQADGGDIFFIKVEGPDIYVKLVGSCSTCPSSIMTMKMGVEALFREEFPGMGQLIQVES